MKCKLFIIVIFFLTVTSCNKNKLSPLPQTALSDAVAFATPERVLAQVNGMYSALKSGQFFGGRYLVYQDIRGEDFLNQTNNGVTGFQTWNFTLTPTTNEVATLWGAAYAAINRINVVLKGLETSPIASTLANQYSAEARFLRGLAYFALVTQYARPYWDNNVTMPGVPLRLKPEISSSAADNLIPRAKVSEIYTQILDDLNFVETNLPLNYNTPYLNTTRAHRNTAIALKTRVYLSMRRYSDVITEANKIVSAAAPFQATSGVPHKLQASFASVYASPYTTEESIFSMPFTSLDLPGTQNGLGSYYNPSPAGLGDYFLDPAGIIANVSWLATDARRTFNQVSGGKTYLRKWPLTPATDYAPVIRYAEVLLNLAEALVRQNNTVDARAVDLLNAVRQRSDPTTIFTIASFATPQALIDQILLERRIEFLGEGLRSLDILRLGQTFPAKGTAPSVAPTSAQYIWPIPLSETLVNKTIEQNPGY